VVIRRGEIWWASLPPPVGSGPGYRRPVLVVQTDLFNESGIQTVVIVILSSNSDLAGAPGNVLCRARQTGLPRNSVINVSQVLTTDKRLLTHRVGMLSPLLIQEVEAGLRLVMGL